jgi:hypothetical protein
MDSMYFAGLRIMDWELSMLIKKFRYSWMDIQAAAKEVGKGKIS